ncbi:hypothetical protein [Mucilaginibacter antarcticus]|uniref:hypothetical protein n=1 Tax=Mucilaginibacter antarcticus TaxID=1855725 RepID=UPI003642F19C
MKKFIIAFAIILTTALNSTFAINAGGEKNNLGTADRREKIIWAQPTERKTT